MKAVSTESKDKQHWIYVLGGAGLREKAYGWAQRKTRQGKRYSVIEGAPTGSSAARLAGVKNDDVLYVFSDAVHDGRLGEWQIGIEELVALVRDEGLDRGHRAFKVFASWSGDAGSSSSFAEQVYRAMLPHYPQIVVFGYRGKVDADGFDGHKTAGLTETESLDKLSRDEWVKKGARARDNRVQFPVPCEPLSGLPR